MKNQKHDKNQYPKFAFIMATSFVIMYLVMFLNVASSDHILNSITRFYMTTLMVSAMAISMLLFMWKMYSKKNTNYAIIVFASVTFFGTIFLLQTQTFVSDVQWMKAMISHHSSAIMTSSSANIKDPEVKKLADDIIEAQEREISQMKQMIQRLENEK
ncbi:MAG: peptidoglycan/LPS O-acetylase OafA/YrhL [Flavobacterium sp.]|jgi:peptidoglycan/LPS O-acetylase OafA/YrhL